MSGKLDHVIGCNIGGTIWTGGFLRTKEYILVTDKKGRYLEIEVKGVKIRK